MQSYLVDFLLRAAVDITARAALAEKTGEQVAQREQAAVSVTTAHNRLFAGADGRVAAGLFAAGFSTAGFLAAGLVAAGLFTAGLLAGWLGSIGLFGAQLAGLAGLVGSIRWDSESRGSQEGKDEEELHGDDGLSGELERYVSRMIKSERVFTMFFCERQKS